METNKIEKPDEQLGYLLMQTSLLKQRIVNARLKKSGITYIQFIILAGILELGIEGEPVTQQTIVTERRLDKAMVSNVVKTLLDKKLMTREIHPDDSRARILKLTKEGEAVTLESKKTVKEIDAVFFSRIDRYILKNALKEILNFSNTDNGE